MASMHMPLFGLTPNGNHYGFFIHIDQANPVHASMDSLAGPGSLPFSSERDRELEGAFGAFLPLFLPSFQIRSLGESGFVYVRRSTARGGRCTSRCRDSHARMYTFIAVESHAESLHFLSVAV